MAPAFIQRIQPSVSEAEWNRQTLANMDRMAADEEYRKSVAKRICPNGNFSNLSEIPTSC